jgi:hypothetical protein
MEIGCTSGQIPTNKSGSQTVNRQDTKTRSSAKALSVRKGIARSVPETSVISEVAL